MTQRSTINGNDHTGPQDYPTVEMAVLGLEARVRILQEELQAFKKHPGTWNVMLYYLKGKGFSVKEVKAVLAGVDEFMRDILVSPRPPQKK